MRKSIYYLSLLACVLCAQTSFGQIISQYVETNTGTTPKGIEIWNNTASTLDFATNNLVIKQGINGAALGAALVTVSTGTLAPGAVMVIGTADIITYVNANAPGTLTAAYTFNFNGDDALQVTYGATVTDVFGTIGTDPGTSWPAPSSSPSTANQNIALASGITTGDTDGWSDPSPRFTTIDAPAGTSPVVALTGFGVAPVLPASCSITAITVTQTAACSDNFTPNTSTDDTYTADVTVTFANAPASGNLVLSGSSLANATETVAVGSLGSSTSHTFTGVPIYATGSLSTIVATFDATPTCTFTNSAIAAVNSCSVPLCAISGVTVGTPSACNDNGTPANPADDYYTANVTVNYTDPASSGNLVLSGDASATVAFFSLDSPTQHIFPNVQLPADGTTNSLTATFSALPSTCTFTNAAIAAVNSCSAAPPCDISAVALSNTGSCNDNGSPTNTTDDYYTTDVTVTFTNPPTTGNLVLSGGASATVAVGSLGSSTSHTFTGIQLPANGTAQSLTATFSGASPACTFTNSSIAAVAACSTPLVCSMTDVALSNLSTCNTNGTAFDPADDYYTADVTVTYANAPFTGNLVLSGSASATVAVGSLGSATSHTFTGIQLPADGATKTLTGAFSADAGCTYTNSTVAAVASCATCQMNTIVLSNISTCNNNGTIGNFADDTYTADVTINYINPPTSGNLVLSGDASATVAVTSIGATSYTFTGVTLPADGTVNTLTASFDATACTVTNAAIAAVNGCSGAPSFALTSCGTSVSENFNSFAGSAASLPGGWVSSSTDYLPGAYYTNTAAYVGSNSTYALGSATDAAYGVKLGSGASPENLSYCVTNNTGSPILSMNVAWNVEQYSAAERPTTVDFFYSIDGGTNYIQTNITGTTLTTATTTAPAANLASVISTPRSIIINGLSVAPGATFCYRFRIANAGASGSNAHIGVDDLVVTPNCTLPCAISDIAVSNTVCSDNGTPNNLTDDTYTADVTVTYANAPTTGNLVLSGDASATVAVSSIGATSYTFTGVTMPADGTVNTLTATFSDNSLCTFTNAAIAAVAPCSTPIVCTISSISVNGATCNDNGTPNNSTDDTYTANVTVNYTNPETTGDLVLSGDASATVAVSSIGATSYTFTGVSLPADGTANTLTATFSANSLCTFTNAAIAAVNSCSVPLAVIQLTNCNTSSAPETFNTYAGSAATVPTGWTITSSLPQSGLYNNTSTLGASNAVYGLLANGVGTETAMGAKVAANSGNPTGTGLATFEYCTTNQTGNTLTGLGLAWDVEQYSEGLRATIVDLQYKVGAGTYAAVTGSAVTAQTNATGANIVPPVITNKTTTLAVPVLPAQQVCFLFSIKTGAGSGNNAHIGVDNFAVTPLCCNISNISLSNVSACNNNGTVPGSTDDTYTADVTVTFANAPATGNLVLSGDATATESVSNLDGTTTHTFVGVTLPADGSTKSITATFDADAACTLTNNSIAAVASCSVPVCGISTISIAPTAVCSDNGTPANPNDDYYLADVTVTYAFAPATGNLVLSGNALAAPAINPQVVFIGASNYVFTGVKLKANGSTNTLTAAFDANTACTNSTTTTATPSCSVACPASFGVFPPTGTSNHN